MLIPIIIYVMTNCSKNLIAEDPWPFAEHSTDVLIYYCKERTESCTDRVQAELAYRLEAHMLTPAQTEIVKKLLVRPWG